MIPISLLESKVQTRNQTVKDMAHQLKVTLVTMQENIEKAQECIKRAVDIIRKEETFKEDDEVVLLTKYLRNLSTHLPIKLYR